MANKAIASFNPDDNQKPLFITWDDTQNSKEKAFKQIGDIHDEGGPLKSKARASRNSVYKDVDTNINVRPTFTRDNYEYFRPEEQTPKKRKQTTTICNEAYHKIGLIKNVIDLMGDFASQGIRIIHKDPKAQLLHEKWWAKINGKERSERFLNILYRLGTVGVLTSNAEINRIDIKNFQKYLSPDDIIVDDSRPSVEIPYSYNFLHPNTLEVIGGDVALLSPGPTKYGVTLPDSIKTLIRNPKSEAEKAIVSNLPKEIKQAAATANALIPLGDNFSIFFYKKDDWEQFPKPMVNAIIDDIMMLEKLKLADLAALDGAISSVRLWRLGSLEHKIMPTKEAVARLTEQLSNNVGGGTFDLIWDATLDFKESSSDLATFLGESKYAPTLNRIYAGLGIPPTLTGSATASGFTNNYISLKTLTERLEYGRSILLNFWNAQLQIIQKALGLREPAKIIFNRMSLSDEAAEKKILLDMLDRHIISDETLRERLGEDSDIELARIEREEKARDEGKMPAKISPLSQQKQDLIKIFSQSGTITPSEVGIVLKDRKPGEKSALQFKQAAKPKTKGVPGQGRPKNKKDSTKRKKKTVKPRSKANFVDIAFWAKNAQAKISEVVMPLVLKNAKKSTARALTDEELNIAEKIKFDVLCNLKPNTKLNDELILEQLAKGSTQADVVYNLLVSNYVTQYGKNPNIDDSRQIQIYAYALYMEEVDNG